jgi:hypothetical protein
VVKISNPYATYRANKDAWDGEKGRCIYIVYTSAEKHAVNSSLVTLERLPRSMTRLLGDMSFGKTTHASTRELVDPSARENSFFWVYSGIERSGSSTNSIRAGALIARVPTE